MKRRKFLAVAAGTIAMAGGVSYLMSDKKNFIRQNSRNNLSDKSFLKSDEREILYLASLSPSGHNTQPWFVKYIKPYHWIIGNDKSRWLPGVDPTQRETILSIGAFAQNLEYAANNLGYSCQSDIIAMSNQDENVMDVKLTKSSNTPSYDIQRIKNRRTIRSNYLPDALRKEDVSYLMNDELDFMHFLPNNTKEFQYLNEQTIEANRLQSYRDAAQKELSDWIRFSSKDAEKFGDGLTMASMEISGIPAWILRNYYDKSKVMEAAFREKSIDTAMKQVSQSAGWLLITSKDNEVTTLLETGKRMQRLFLKVREKGIALHPMTQILEESKTRESVNQSIGITDTIQFILRLGYVKNYPDPVSLRRPVERFVI